MVGLKILGTNNFKCISYGSSLSILKPQCPPLFPPFLKGRAGHLLSFRRSKSAPVLKNMFGREFAPSLLLTNVQIFQNYLRENILIEFSLIAIFLPFDI